MKLQYLIIIFLAIMLPIVLVLSQYIGIQVDAIAMKNKYDAALLGATFDMMSAFEINTRNVSNSDALGEEIREIEAVINTFSNSLSSSLGMTGTAKDYILSYVPAIVFCLYDGYYLYTPTNSEDEQKLKPYVYYTKTYTNGSDTDITIAYSLDNYVSIYGTYAGKSISEAGYLIVCADNVSSNKGVWVSNDFAYVATGENNSTNMKYSVIQGNVKYNGVEIEKETLYENKPSTNSTSSSINVNLASEETTDAMVYYYEAYRFTKIYNEVVGHLNNEDKKKLIVSQNNNPENMDSNFMDEKINVIQDTLNKGVKEAIYKYKGSKSDEFEIPNLTGEDWNKILNNISAITFMMDIPLKNMTAYNKYAIVNSTTNQKYISSKSIDFIGYKSNNETASFYHKITCEEMINNINNGTIADIKGYASVDFERYKMEYQNGDSINYAYYNKHNEYAGYECEIGTIENVNVSEIEDYLNNTQRFPDLSDEAKNKILKAYYTAVGRIRFRLTKASSYIRMSTSYEDVFGEETKKCIVTFEIGNGKSNQEVKSNYGRINILNNIQTNTNQVLKCWKTVDNKEINVNSVLYYNEVKSNVNDKEIRIKLKAEYV